MEGEQRWKGRVYRAPSRIQGTGMFAARGFRPGELIISRDESLEVSDTSPLPAGARWEEVCDWLDDGRTVLIDEPARYLNHSCEPNTYIRHAGMEGQIVALRDIDAGEELTTDYQMSGRGGSVWACNCGTQSCRGRVGPNFWTLPLVVQVRYLPFVSQALIEQNAESIAAIRKAAGAE